MKNIAIQDKHGTCGIFNLANIWQDKNILTYANYDEFIPCGYQEVNKILENEGYDIRQRGLIVNFCPTVQIPINFLKKTLESYSPAMKNLKIDTSNIVGVFPLVVRAGKSETEEGLHAITLYIHVRKGIYAYSDPLNEGAIRLKAINELLDIYKYVNTAYCFENNKGTISIDDNEDLIKLFQD